VGVEEHAFECPFFFFGAQEARCCWGVGHGEEAYDAEDDGNCALEYKHISAHVSVSRVDNSLKKIHGQRL
jgi:hypothetical protein